MTRFLKCLVVLPFILLGVMCGLFWSALAAGFIWGEEALDKLATECRTKL